MGELGEDAPEPWLSFRALAPVPIFLGPALVRSLDEQDGNHGGLRGDDRNRSEQVNAMVLPDRRLSADDQHDRHQDS
jgi:hypothetical protein